MATTKHIKISNGGLLKVVETKVNCNYSAVDGVQIDKILDNIVNPSVSQAEKVNDQLDIVGRVGLTSLYLDTEKNLQTNISVVDFSEKVQVPDADAIVVVPKVKSVKSRKETAVFVDLVITLELEIYGVIQETLSFVEAGNEGLNELTDEVSTDSLLCFNSSVAENMETIELEAESKVLSTYSSLAISKVVPNGNFVTLSGEITRDVIYSLGGNIKRVQKRSDVQEEVSLLNCTADTPCFSKCFISGEVFEAEANENGVSVTITTSLSISVWGFENTKFTILKDAFSCNKNISLTSTSFEALKYNNSAVYSDQLSVVEDVTKFKRIDEVLAIGSNTIKVKSTNFSDGMFNITGTISQTIIGKNYDNDDIFSLAVDSEFQTTINNIPSDDATEFDYSLVAQCLSCKNKAGKEIALNYNINVLFNSKVCKNEVLIKEIEEGGELEQNPYSIFVYKPETNEKVFDIAKKLCVTPDCVLSQNPDIVDGKPIERVAVYKRVQKNN